jgi:predicted RNase H-like nuclease
LIAGVDACAGGWIVAIAAADGSLRVEKVAGFSELVNRSDLRMIVVDIPIGLLERGVRRADGEARRLLKGRASCVFNAPIRPILGCTSRVEASTRWQEVENKKCSAQGWGIVPKVHEVDAVLHESARIQGRVREGHPEVTFAVMNAGVPLPRKHDLVGREARLELLSKSFGDAPRRCARALARCFPDVLDAFAMLWTAGRVLQGIHLTIPDGMIELDSHGLRAEMVI